MNNGWIKVNESLWNNHLTYAQNRKNGCRIPPEGRQVLIYDKDKSKYFVGIIGTDMSNNRKLVAYETINGNIYSKIKSIYWKMFAQVER